MTNCIKYWYLINFIFVFFPNLYNQFCNFYNTTWYDIKKNKEDNQESKTNIKENLTILRESKKKPHPFVAEWKRHKKLIQIFFI